MAKKETKKPEKAAKENKGKNKKDKKGKGAAAAAAPAGAAANGVPPAGAQSIPLSQMSPEQMTAAQLEQAIKESNDPNTRLKKLRSPVNLRSCLLNVLILIVATLAVVILWCWIVVDDFNFVTIMSDMMNKFGITQFFKMIGSTIAGWFS